VPDLDAIFKAYDIRGTTPDQLDAGVARAVGEAFAVFAARESTAVSRILVGRDMRPTGVGLAQAFKDGVRTQGLDGVELGLASTDLVYFAAGRRDAPAAMLTASHHPTQNNGIKLCLAGARPGGEDAGLQDIKAMTADGVPAHAGPTGAHEARDLLDDFADHVRSFIEIADLRPLRVVADTANGMGGLVVPAVFEGLPVDLEVLYGELDGTFPNHPADPIQPENLRDLQARVLDVGADVGLAFDGDADRVFLVDELGQPLSGSTTTAIVASGVLEKHPGSTILHNCICSKAVPEAIRERGGTPVRTKVGHSFIKAVMADTGAAFGGEHSAHYYFRDNWRADSGSIAALMVLEQMGRSGLSLSELRQPFDRYAGSGEINFRVDDPSVVIDGVAAAFPAEGQDRLDGLTVDLGDWWFNLRASNTEPLLRLNLEAPDAATCAARVADLQALLST
jgi:phosphomannomutase